MTAGAPPGDNRPRVRTTARQVFRSIGRLAFIVVLDAVVLLLLSLVMSTFTLNGPWAALGLAVILGLANAVVWPLIVRFALPFTVLTLGFGALILNAALLLGANALMDSVQIDGLLAAVIIVLGLTAITTVVGGILALGENDMWYREVVRRQLKRSDLAVSSDVPGLLLLEIDGLAHGVLRRALRDGNAPTLARWMREDGYHLEEWETDWSSQTGACQAGLLHGSNEDMPAFRWWEKDLPAGRSSPTTPRTPRRSSAATPTGTGSCTPTARAGRTSSPATRRTACSR